MHTLSGPFFVRATIFFTRIYHHTTVTLTFVLLSLHKALFRAFWSVLKNNRITFPARDESDESEPVGVAAAVAVGKRRARDRRSEVVHAAEFTAVVARGNESRRGGVRERGRRGE